MKGGDAVILRLAATVPEPNRDVTFILYEAEEIDAEYNGLHLLGQSHPELIAADFAILMEPSNAGVEAGCQGTLRVEVRTTGERAHSARSWRGVNAIHAAGADPRPAPATTSRASRSSTGWSTTRASTRCSSAAASPATCCPTSAWSRSTTASPRTAPRPTPRRSSASSSTGTT